MAWTLLVTSSFESRVHSLVGGDVVSYTHRFADAIVPSGSIHVALVLMTGLTDGMPALGWNPAGAGHSAAVRSGLVGVVCGSRGG